MVLIRTARYEDAASIARVHVESWRTAYRGIVPEAYLAGLNIEERTTRWGQILTSPSRVLAAERDGKIVGFIAGGPIRQPVGECDAELYAIYIDLPVRGKGIGTALLSALAKLLDEDGFKSMAAWVLDANSATTFYQRTGAASVAAKEIEIGGALLPATAYAWPSLPKQKP